MYYSYCMQYILYIDAQNKPNYKYTLILKWILIIIIVKQIILQTK